MKKLFALFIYLCLSVSVLIYAQTSDRIDASKMRFESGRSNVLQDEALSERAKLVSKNDELAKDSQDERARLNAKNNELFQDTVSSRQFIAYERIERLRIFDCRFNTIEIETFRFEQVNVPELRFRDFEFTIFVPDEALVNAFELVRLKITYPKAYKYQNDIEPFSHFGFLKEDVEEGTLSKEEFLRQYEEYLKQL